MTKNATISSRSPLAFLPSVPVFAEDFVEVLENLNYVAAETPQHHGGELGGDVGWDGGSAAPGHQVLFDNGSTGVWEERFDWITRLDGDVEDLSIRARVLVNGADEVALRVLVEGTPIVQLNFTSADNGTFLTGTIAVLGGGGIGTGNLNFTLELQRVSGSNTDHQLVSWDIDEDVYVVGNFPDPTG